MPETTVQITEIELVAMLKAGDQKGLRYLYDHYSQVLFTVIYKIVPVQEIAEELLQETFVKVWNNFGAYDNSKGRLYTWMLNIARNLAIDKIRSADFKSQSQTNSIENNVYTASQTSDEETVPEHLDLKTIVQLLRPEQKELIDLIYFLGYTQAEAAEKLKMPLGTVKTRVRSAMIALRQLFR